MRDVRAGVPPVLLGDLERGVEHRLRAQPARGEADRRAAVFLQLLPQVVGHADGGHLGEVVEERFAVAAVGLLGAVGDLDEQPAGVADEERQRGVAGDDVRLDAEAHDPQPLVEIHVPHRRLLSRHHVEEDVAAPQSLTRMSRRPCSRSMRSTRARTCSGSRWSVGTAIPRPVAPAAASTSSRRLLDGLRGPADLADVLAGRPSRHVHRGPCTAQLHRHGPPGASGGTRDQGHLSPEGLCGLLPCRLFRLLPCRLCCCLHGPSIPPNADICCRTFRGHVRA